MGIVPLRDAEAERFGAPNKPLVVGYGANAEDQRRAARWVRRTLNRQERTKVEVVRRVTRSARHDGERWGEDHHVVENQGVLRRSVGIMAWRSASWGDGSRRCVALMVQADP